jgi:hypothetical protein
MAMAVKPVQPSWWNTTAHGYMNTISTSKTMNRMAVR